MSPQFELLAAARVNRIMAGLQDIRLLPQQLIWNSRIPTVPATDEEILARWLGRVYAADIIMDDAKAVVVNPGQLSLETVKIPNLKIGVNLTQSMINSLNRLGTLLPAAAQAEVSGFDRMQTRNIAAVNLGVAQRREALLVAMLADGQGNAYNRFGVQMINPSWGMPANLKVTTGVTWDTAGSATPVNDIIGVQLVGRTLYGVNYDRLTMSTQAFRYMIATTEFQNKARQFLAPNVSFVNLAQGNIRSMLDLAANTIGMKVELYDARFFQKNEDGSDISIPYLPITQVLLTDSGNDGNSEVYNFGNTPTTEGIVANAVGGGQFGTLPAGPGPIAYVTVPHDLNSPNITTWGVQRGFPRKGLLQSSAVLTVGAFADTIPVGVPFPS